MEEEGNFDIKFQCSKCGNWTPNPYPIRVRFDIGGIMIAAPGAAMLCENCYKVHKSEFKEESE